MSVTILIVEDDEDMASFLDASMTQEGFHVSRANTVAKAIHMLGNQKYDCLLLDLQLGSQSGEEIIRFVHQRGGGSNFNADTPILVLSGHLDVELITRIKTHVNSVLVKPFDHKKLISIVKALVGLHPVS